MDSALSDGRENAVVEEGLEQALQAVRKRTEPIVVLGFKSGRCSTLEEFEERVLVAIGESSYGPKSKKKGKSETLLGVPLKKLCLSSSDDEAPESLEAAPPSESVLQGSNEQSDLKSR